MTEPVFEKRRWKDLVAAKPLVYAVVFTIGLLIFERIFLDNATAQEFLILTRHVAAGTYMRLAFVLALSLVSIGLLLIFAYAAFASPYRYRIFYFVIFSLSVVSEYGHYLAFGRFSRFRDIEIAFFAGDWKFTAGALAMYFNWLAVFPVLVFSLCLFLVRPKIRSGAPTLAAVVLGLTTFFCASAYFSSNLFYTASFSAGLRTATSFPIIWYAGTFDNGKPRRASNIEDAPRRTHYRAARYPVDFQAETTPQNNVVFIVDESVRGDHLSLNGYERATTPILDSLKQNGYLKNWGIAASGTTCSTTSNNLMMTGVTDLPDYDYQVYYLPTILRYARAMNYKTHFIDGQTTNLWNGKPYDEVDYGQWVKADELAARVQYKYEVDGEIARHIKRVTSSGTGNFIWVSKVGVHKPYSAAFPNETNAAPASEREDTSYRNAERRAVIDEYDEAVTYNLQSFFSNLFSGTPDKDTFYIYTSDHGQTLMENGAMVSHCAESRSEAVVPLFMIADPARLAGIDTDYRASHANIFATLLDLTGFPHSERRYQYALSLITARREDSVPRTYYAGELHGIGDGRRFPFE